MIELRIKAGEFQDAAVRAIIRTFAAEQALCLSLTNKAGKVENLIFGLDIEGVAAQLNPTDTEMFFIAHLKDKRQFLVSCQRKDFPNIQNACLRRIAGVAALAEIKKWKVPEEAQLASLRNNWAIAILAFVGFAFFIGSSTEKPTPENQSHQPSLAQSEAIPSLLDVPGLIGRSQKEVISMLGKPTCETENISRVGKVPTCTYDQGSFSVEITFINKKADWISVEGLSEELAYGPEAITALGMPQFSGYVEGPVSYSWLNVSRYHEIMIFSAGSRVSYIYVKAVTD